MLTALMLPQCSTLKKERKIKQEIKISGAKK